MWKEAYVETGGHGYKPVLLGVGWGRICVVVYCGDCSYVCGTGVENIGQCDRLSQLSWLLAAL